MRFASLGSGSRGNATLIEHDGTRLLVDCGFSLKETRARLDRLGLEGDDLSGVLVTHEHGDHIKGLGAVARAFGLPVWMTHGTLQQCERLNVGALPDMNIIDTHALFSIGDIEVTPFTVPHDAREPCQFVFADGAHRLGLLTDLGSTTPHIEARLAACDALMVECNYDHEMLMQGPYPESLKQRINSPFGHLDNLTAAELVSKLDFDRLQELVIMHISEKNNRPELARAALHARLGCDQDWIKFAHQDDGLHWHSLTNRVC